MKPTAWQWLAISSIAIGMITPAMARTRPRYGGTVRVQMRGEAFGADVRSVVAESLTEVEDTGRVQPKLSVRWESQNGDRRWQFWLRAGVRFHDGSPLTPAAVTKALTTGECESCPWESVRATSDSVILENDSPMPQLAARLAAAEFAITKLDDQSRALIGTGPFRVISSAERSVQLAAFEDYWQGRTFVDAMEVAGGRGREGLGSLDVSELAADQLRRAQQSRLRTLVSRPMLLVVLSIGTSSVQLQDSRARQAMAYSIDRASLLNVIYQRQGEITGSMLPQWMTGYGFLFPTAQNLTRARELRRGINVNGSITLAYNEGDAALQLVAERIALNAREAGFTVQTIVRSPDTRADMYVSIVRLPSFEPSLALDDIRSRFTGPEPPATALTPDQLLRREREALASYNIVPLLYLPLAFGASDRVRNWRLNEAGAPDFENVWLEQRR